MPNQAVKSQSIREPFIPIYQKLFTQYRDAIITQQYGPGDRVHSINEMMDRHKIARETAKAVLKMLSNDGYIIQQPGKGSFVANLGPLKKVWGVVVPFFSAQIEELIFYLGQEASKRGRELEHFVDYNHWQEEIQLVGKLINERYEAVIVIPTFDETETASFYTRLKPGGTVVSLIDHTMAGSYFTYVIQSYDLGVKRGVQHLLNRPSGTLAFVKNNIWLKRNMVQELMQDTFQDCIENSRKGHRSLILNNVEQISKELIIQSRICGFFCCDDSDAIRVVGRLKDWGFIIPDEISIVSYGNTELAKYFTPAITSIDPYSAEMAATTAKIIHQKQKGEDVSFCQYVLQPDLIVRKT
ncbi:substrate-binding domain-containing protein [candidate division KSB1 bacterium]|nr:substrate-binding domain-containing protein [candidate division KSB1 bacterium]